LTTLTHHTDVLYCLAISSNTSMLVSGSGDKSVRVTAI